MSFLSDIFGEIGDFASNTPMDALGFLGIGPKSPAALAQQKRQDILGQNEGFFKTLFDQYGGASGNEYRQGIGSLNSDLSRARSDLLSGFSSAEGELQNLFTSQRGQFQGLLSDVMDAGRQQAARTGLIGGSQEASIVNPAIENLTQSFGTMAAQSRLGLENSKINALSSLNSFGTSQRSELLKQRLGSLGNLQQGAFAALTGVKNSSVEAAGQYQGDILGDVAGIIGAIFGKGGS